MSCDANSVDNDRCHKGRNFMKVAQDGLPVLESDKTEIIDLNHLQPLGN